MEIWPINNILHKGLSVVCHCYQIPLAIIHGPCFCEAVLSVVCATLTHMDSEL